MNWLTKEPLFARLACNTCHWRNPLSNVLLTLFVALMTSRSASAASDDERSYGRPDQSKSAEAVYQEQHALFDRRFTFEAGLTYSHFDRKQLALNGFMALDSIFLGNISVDDVNGDILTLDLAARWGISRRLQLDLAVPFLYRRTVYQATSSESQQNVTVEEAVTMDPEFQLGDASVGLYYQIVPEMPNRPDIVWNIRAKGPTGKDPYGIKNVTVDPGGNLTVPEELASGNGVWTVSSGFSFVKTNDPMILFANLGYYHNLIADFDDISTTPGSVVPGSIKLGDSFFYGVGTAVALNERTSISFSYSQRFTRASESRVEGGRWSKIVGSDANSATFSVGMTHALSDRLSMVFNLGMGLTDDASDVQWSVKFPYAF